MIRSIVLCIDGEEFTGKAVNYALEIAWGLKCGLTALHVIDPYLKSFANEIYAVGRLEYKDHMERELRRDAQIIVESFRAKAEAAGVPYKIVLRYGSPWEEILREVTENPCDLLILGAKPLDRLSTRIRSLNMPKKIFNSLKVPTLFVR